MDELLGQSERIGDALFLAFQEVRQQREKYRSQLQSENLIHRDSELGYPDIPTTCGIDGSYGIERLLSTDLVATAAVAIEGLTPPSEMRHWERPHHKPFIQPVKHHEETSNIIRALMMHAEQHYQQNRSLNTLVIVDEAHRLAPGEHIDDEALQVVRNRFIDAVRTTRKYGLGWMFISQTLSSLHREIIQQIRIFFFGFGLALGTEFQALKELIGGDQTSIRLYQTFRDPHSAFDSRSREYPFMTVGPVSPLSFAGTPLFFTAFNNAEEFLRQNRLNPSQEQLKL